MGDRYRTRCDLPFAPNLPLNTLKKITIVCMKIKNTLYTLSITLTLVSIDREMNFILVVFEHGYLSEYFTYTANNMIPHEGGGGGG